MHPRAVMSERRVSVPVAVQAANIAAAVTRFAAWINAGAVVMAALIGAFVVLALAYWPPPSSPTSGTIFFSGDQLIGTSDREA